MALNHPEVRLRGGALRAHSRLWQPTEAAQDTSAATLTEEGTIGAAVNVRHAAHAVDGESAAYLNEVTDPTRRPATVGVEGAWEGIRCGRCRRGSTHAEVTV